MSKAEQTRAAILQKAFELIYANGFQSTSIDHIISNVQVTKGAFFYHFKNKEEMGISLIKELLRSGMRDTLKIYLLDGKDPVVNIYQMVKFLLIDSPLFEVRYGCPAVNLIEEMSPLNANFHKELAAIIKEWQDLIVTCLENGKTEGNIRRDVNSKNVAYFITSGYAGVRNMGKIFGKECYSMHLQELEIYLNNLS